MPADPEPDLKLEDVSRDVLRLCLTPGTDMSFVQITITESPHFYEAMGANADYKPRELTVFADVHQEFEGHMFFALEYFGRPFLEHFRSTENLAWNNQQRRTKLEILSIVHDHNTFHLDRSPCEDVYLEQWMDFLADIQNFYDKTPPRHRQGLLCPDYFHGLHKELPAGGTVTQVLHASVPRIGYWWGGMRGDGGSFWHQFMFRS